LKHQELSELSGETEPQIVVGKYRYPEIATEEIKLLSYYLGKDHRPCLRKNFQHGLIQERVDPKMEIALKDGAKGNYWFLRFDVYIFHSPV
jgi:hypothetical protein